MSFTSLLLRRRSTSLPQPADDIFPLSSQAVGRVERRADRAVRRLHVGAAVDQRAGHVDIVAARRPVQGRLGARLVRVTGVRVRARFDEQPHDLGTVWKVSRPVGNHVQGRASFGAAAEPRRGEPRVVGEEPAQCGEVAGADGGNCVGEGIGGH